MINDLLIEPDSLRLHDAGEVSVGVRLPWYRAVPLSCIVDAIVDVDDTPLAGHTLTIDGHTHRPADLPALTDDSWFPTDTLTVRGRLPRALEAGGEHRVRVTLHLHIPYIVTAHGVLLIEEVRELAMTAREAVEVAA